MAFDIPPDAIMAWHFVGDTLRDGRPVPADGELLSHEGDVVPCKSGLHASERIIDALLYAPGNTICRVAVWGDVQRHGDDKIAGRHRVILWRIDGEPVLRDFARRQALSVAHHWNMPDLVRQYLETGDKSIRAAARDAAIASARDAALAAERAATRAVALAAERAATRAAASAAALDAALDAARAAASAAARDAAWAAANTMLTEMVDAAR